MRRSTFFLAIVGLGLNSVAAQDVFGPSTVRPKLSGTSQQYYGSTATKGETSTKSTERFQRTNTRPQSSPTQSRPNYYSELFGSKDATVESRTKLKPAASIETKAVSNVPGEAVIQAEFQADPLSHGSKIQQVRAARPFPGRTPPVNPVAPPKPSLTTPIQVSSQAPAGEVEVPAVPAAKQAGTVTFSQGRPTEKSLRSAPTVVTAEALSGPQTPSVTIEWKQHSAINVGQECRCDLVVKNTGKTAASGVAVEAFFPTNVRLLGSVPSPATSETFLGWEFANLKPGEEKVISIRMLPLQRGDIATRANVRFTGTASNVFSVSEPLLAVSVKGPEQVMVGESASQTIVVTNPGNGIASNVQIEALIPEGLEHTRGNRILMEIGSLNPGETRNIRLAMSALAGGQHQIHVQARADAGLNQKAVAEVAVVAPSLLATIDGPGLRYLGRQGIFKLSIANDGAAATSNVQVMHKIPDGFEFISADKGVQYDKASRLMTWFVGRLEKDAASEIHVTLSAKKIGEHKHLIRATSEHGSLADAELISKVEGISSLSVEVLDLDDPVELGTEAVYEVRVKNEGSAPAHDVGLACELASGVNYIAATGPAQHISENSNVVFRTIPEIGPGKTAVYRVRVQSNVSGNTRFRARVTSESVDEPLTTDELTKFYGE